MAMKIEAIHDKSAHLEVVKKLWRSHSNTLGFLPDGGFQDYARDRHVVVALDGADQCVGYLLYRVVRDRAAIAQFCIAPECRRQGYARALIDWLISKTKKNRGILLTCCRHYTAARTWERLGFHAVSEKPSKAEGSTGRTRASSTVWPVVRASGLGGDEPGLGFR